MICLTFSPYGLKGAVKFNPSISFPCLNAAWNMIKEESEQRGTECAPQCHVWSCICYVSAGGGDRVSDSCCFAMSQLTQLNISFLFVYLSTLCWRETFWWPPARVTWVSKSETLSWRDHQTLYDFSFIWVKSIFVQSLIRCQWWTLFYFLCLVCFCGFLSIREKFLCMTLNNRHTSHLFCRHKCCWQKKALLHPPSCSQVAPHSGGNENQIFNYLIHWEPFWRMLSNIFTTDALKEYMGHWKD